MKPTLSAEIEASSSDEQSTGSQASGNVDGSKLVSTVSKKQQAVSGWNDIVDKVVSTFEPDLPTSSACVLLVSVAIMMANEAAHFVSRATDGVDGLEFQNTMGAPLATKPSLRCPTACHCYSLSPPTRPSGYAWLRLLICCRLCCVSDTGVGKSNCPKLMDHQTPQEYPPS